MFDLSSVAAAKLLLEALDRGQHPFLTVTSDSMAPLFRRGDQMQLGPISPADLRTGDIIILGLPGDLLAHRFYDRIVADGRDYLMARGDRLAYYDPPVPIEQLQAFVIGRRREDRYLSLVEGSGAWLNRTLARLAGLDTRLLRLPRTAVAGEAGQVAHVGPTRRLLRRLLYTLAVLLNSLVHRLPE